MKNKNVFYILVIAGIIFTILHLTNDMPEDKNISSGYSFSEKIDNFSNVENYKYTLKTNVSKDVSIQILKDLSYSFAEYSYNLEQFPQGICFTDEYLFVTSYSKKESALGEVYVFDRETEEFLIKFGMDKSSHLGGITFDGENIWVCNSSDMTLERISYRFICYLIENYPKQALDISDIVEKYSVNNIPSCITCYKGRLWVATHNIWASSKMIAYYFDKENNALESLTNYTIPAQVQGVTFSEQGEVYFSISYGRRNSSYILKYESLYELLYSEKNYSIIIEMPPCSEEIIIEDEKLYVIFESANEIYLNGKDGCGSSISPLNKILILNLNSR